MNSRQRLLCAVEQRMPDRVPIALHFAPEAAQKLRGRLGLSDQDELLEWCGVDLVRVGPAFTWQCTQLRLHK
jgi:hypothetical protein